MVDEDELNNCGPRSKRQSKTDGKELPLCEEKKIIKTDDKGSRIRQRDQPKRSKDAIVLVKNNKQQPREQDEPMGEQEKVRT